MSRCYSCDAIRRDPNPRRDDRQPATQTPYLTMSQLDGIIIEVRAECLSDASVGLGVSHAIGLAKTVR